MKTKSSNLSLYKKISKNENQVQQPVSKFLTQSQVQQLEIV